MFEIKFDEYKAPYEAIPLGHQGEKEARCLIWDVSEYIETFGRGGVQVKVTQPETGIVYMATNVNLVDEEAKWTLTDVDTAKAGTGMCELYYTDQSGNVLAKSHVMRFWILPTQGDAGDTPSPYEDLIDTIAEYASTAQSASNAATASAARAETAAESAASAAEDIVDDETAARIAADTNLQTQITSLRGAVGAPTTAVLASLMTDTDKIYVYTGNESGYNYGHWYYYNGTQWADGGIYNSQALETDKTLTVSDMAADAAVVGEKIDECMAAFVVESTSGSIASFADGADGVPLRDLVVNIQPKQAGSGDPSPSNVRAISGWTAAKITRCGKNYLQSELADGTYYGMSFTNVKNATGVITGFLINGTSTGSPGTLPIVKFYQPNNIKMVVECTTPTDIAFRWRTRWKNNGVVQGSSSDAWFYTKNGRQELSLSVPPGYDEYDACFVFSNGVTCDNLAISAMIVNANETDDTFEPYNGNTYNISFGNAGTVYGGTLDVMTGALTVTHTIVDLGTVSFTTGTGDGFTVFMHQFSNKALNYNYVCSNYATVPTGRYEITNNGIGTYNATNARNYICIRDDSKASMTAAEFQSAMSGVQFCYEVTQPVSVQLDPVSVASLLGQNNIWSDTGSVASCEYRADTMLYLEKLTNPDDDMVANANITSGQYFMVNNNLYLATANIANGGAITPGTNCTATNLAAALNAINS